MPSHATRRINNKFPWQKYIVAWKRSWASGHLFMLYGRKCDTLRLTSTQGYGGAKYKSKQIDIKRRCIVYRS